MEENYNVVGNFLEELREAGRMDCCENESTPLSITEEFGSFYTIICC